MDFRKSSQNTAPPHPSQQHGVRCVWAAQSPGGWTAGRPTSKFNLPLGAAGPVLLCVGKVLSGSVLTFGGSSAWQIQLCLSSECLSEMD